MIGIYIYMMNIVSNKAIFWSEKAWSVCGVFFKHSTILIILFLVYYYQKVEC